MNINCIIAGGRNFTNYDSLKKAMATVKFENNDVTIISGTARGADSLGERYAKKNKLELKRFPANWNKYGKAAGPIRNKEMLEHADCCHLLLGRQKPENKKHDRNHQGSRKTYCSL